MDASALLDAAAPRVRRGRVESWREKANAADAKLFDEIISLGLERGLSVTAITRALANPEGLGFDVHPMTLRKYLVARCGFDG